MIDNKLSALHVFPEDLARGAQRRARAVSKELDAPGAAHRTLSIFSTAQPAMFADSSLDIGRTRFGRLFDPRAVSALRREFRDHGPGIVVAYGSEALRYCVLAAWRRHPIVYSKIGHVTENVRGLRLLFHGWLTARADFVAAVSSDAAREAHELLGVAQDRIFVVSNGRDPAVFHPPDQPRPTSPIRILWVGQVVEGKRPDLFLDLVERLRFRSLHVVAAVAGTGSMLIELHDRAESTRVSLLGQRSDVAELMRQSDILVFTSNGQGEGMPGVLIEAGLCGLPVVATDVPGVRDVVLEGKTGFICGVDDADAMEQALVRLVEDHASRHMMGANARSRCVELFSIEASAAKWSSLLAQC